MAKIDIEKYIEVFISDDEMTADIFMSPEMASFNLTIEEIVDFAYERGVKYGIDENIIIKALEEKNFGDMIIFASGTYPKEGKDGYYDYKFDINATKKRNKPVILKDGTADYKNIELIQCVRAGDVLAEYFSAVQGENGCTVTGKTIKTNIKKDLPPLHGHGFEICEDGHIYKSLINGKPELNFGILEIKSVCEIPGDVDLSTGNIDFSGDLFIEGNIKSGMNVKATGNITINGLIESANVYSGKAILVKGGIFGSARTNIEANGDIIANFIENAKVHSGNDIVAGSMINCVAVANHDIKVISKNSQNEKAGAIIGGTIKANRYIRSRIIGSPVGIRTDISVGISYKVQNEYLNFKSLLSDAQAELNKIEKAIELLEKKQGTAGQLMLSLVKTKIDKASYVYKYKEICSKIEKNISEGRDAKVFVANYIYPGVIIRIDDIGAVTSEKYRTIVFKRKDKRIMTQKYEKDMDEI